MHYPPVPAPKKSEGLGLGRRDIARKNRLPRPDKKGIPNHIENKKPTDQRSSVGRLGEKETEKKSGIWVAPHRLVLRKRARRRPHLFTLVASLFCPAPTDRCGRTCFHK